MISSFISFYAAPKGRPSVALVVLGLVLAAVAAASPLFGRSLLTTRDGAEILGDVEQEQFDFVAEDGGDLILPRAALDRLRTLPDGTLEVTLKDGKTVRGTLTNEVTITDGLIKRRIASADISEIFFDVFVPLAGKGEEVVCPLRAAVEVPAEMVVGKLKKWRTSRTWFASCEGNRLTSFQFSRQAGALQTRVKKGEEPRKGTMLFIKPGVTLAPGEDQFVHLTFILMQGDHELGRVVRQFPGDEGEVNRFPPVKLWVAPDDVASDGPPLHLRFQMLTRERGTGKEPGAVFLWFVNLRL